MKILDRYFKQTPKCILLRALLALVVVLLLAPPLHWLFTRERFTTATFMKLLGIVILPLVVLTLIQLLDSRSHSDSADSTARDQKHDV